MRDILRQSNFDLLREINLIKKTLDSSSDSISDELRPYNDWVLLTWSELQNKTVRNLQDLDLREDVILPEILSSTQSVTIVFHEFNQRWVSPVLRALLSDRLCLKLLRWLHTSHPITQLIPIAIGDGDFSSLPAPPMPTIYFMPPSAQRELLYLPLFFHEFGHLLYACQKGEMDIFVRNLQEKISQLLAPSVQHDDRHAQIEMERRTAIVETWYVWIQEIFCDAVGFVIGGPAFIHAFSIYLRMLGRGEYRLPPDQLMHRPHPVTWLRVRLLADFAQRTGCDAEAKELSNTWNIIASAMDIIEDYYGYYTPDFLPTIQQTIDQMLTHATPRRFSKQEISNTELVLPITSPVRLLNQAWYEFLKDAEKYPTWEANAIDTFLNTDFPP